MQMVEPIRRVAAAAHDVAAVRLLQPLYRVYRAARPSWRPGMVEYYRGLRMRRQSAGWSAGDKLAWIRRQLGLSLRRAATEVPYYRELFAHVGFDPASDFDFTDFARIPILERAIVRDQGDALRSAVRTDRLRRDSTGGSTGEPTHIWTGPEERGWRESGIEHFMRRIGLPSGSRTALLWGHNLDPLARSSIADRLHDWADNVRWLDCLRLSPEVIWQYHEQMERWKPQIVLAYASALADVASELATRGVQPSYPTRCFVTGAEKLTSDQRRLVEKVFRRPVYERYGSRDVGLMGFQLGTGTHPEYTIDWTNVLVEPETEEEYSPILVTKLHADAMPMIRYRIGDIGHFPRGSAPGMPTFTLLDVVGRETDRIWLPTNRWVNGLELPHLLKDYPVRDFQLVQHRDLSVVLKVVPHGAWTEESQRKILDVLSANLAGVDLELELVNDIPKTASNKRRPVISHVDAQPLRGPA
jgi:phenylacetate-CoA ligase